MLGLNQLRPLCYISSRASTAQLGYNHIMLRKSLTILSLIGLLLSVGLWGVSYFYLTGWWGRTSAHLVQGRLSWNNQFSQKLNAPLAWRFHGFQGLAFKRLKLFPPKYWGIRRAPPLPTTREEAMRIPRGEFALPNVALPGISISWNRAFEANGVIGWDYSCAIVLWVPTLLSGIVLCLCRPLHHRRRRKRKKLGLCVKCGYDLRGSNDVCPECGTEFEKK